MTYLRYIFTVALIWPALFLISCTTSDQNRRFDGESFQGWEGDKSVFRIEEGAIVGGQVDTRLKKSHYLCSEKRYGDFELNLKVKISGEQALRNAGISFRAERVPDSTQVAGYQADVGYILPKVIARFSEGTPDDMGKPYPLWGILVDEHRANTSRYTIKGKKGSVCMLVIPDRELLESSVRVDEWNEYRILAQGPYIELSINGVVVVEYEEVESWVPREGIIGLQIHSGSGYEVRYKDIHIKEL